MKKVLVLCPYPHGKAPSQRFRFEQYLDVHGVGFTQESFWREDEWPGIYQEGSIQYKVLSTLKGFGRRLGLLFQVRKYDKVFIHREATPIGPPWFEWAVTKIFRKPIVFDFDDAIWLPNSSKANEKLAGKLKFHGKTAKICSWATTCSVGNAFLADYAKQFCNDVRIIPTTIDTVNHHNPDLYEKIGSKWKRKNEKQQTEGRRPQADHDNSDDLQNEDGSVSPFLEGVAPTAGGDGGGESVVKRNDQDLTQSYSSEKSPEAKSLQPAANRTNYVTIGWTGTHSTLKQLVPLFPLLEKLHNEIPFHFLLIADIPPDSMPPFVEFRQWKKETEIEDLMEMDIGVMPLYDTDWERGKCGFKALQYQALEIPALVSNVGVNTDVVREGETGFICEALPLSAAEKWKKNLTNMMQNAEQRVEFGKKARAHVIREYSVSSQRKTVADLV